jgi:hypothetical protein
VPWVLELVLADLGETRHIHRGVAFHALAVPTSERVQVDHMRAALTPLISPAKSHRALMRECGGEELLTNAPPPLPVSIMSAKVLARSPF